VPESEQLRVHAILQCGALAHEEEPPAGALALLALLERRQPNRRHQIPA
jgi:hypothetical protein